MSDIMIDDDFDMVVDGSDMATLRDQFAMAALTGLCANPDYKANKDKFAVTAYELAEEMLAARGGK